MTGTPSLRDSDDQSHQVAATLLRDMRHATLAVVDPISGHPHLSRILCQTDATGHPVALLSSIAIHSRILSSDPRAALMIDSPRSKGDPMTWPRLTVQVIATHLPPDSLLHARWLSRHPVSQLFLGLPDFGFWQLRPIAGVLNAGFGAAFRLDADALSAAGVTTPPQG